MADGRFNIAKGRTVQMVIANANKFGLLLLQVAQADATLEDHATVAAIVAAANTRATFTNYTDKIGLIGTQVVDNTNNWNDVDIDDQLFTAAGGTLDNNLVKAIIFFDDNAGADADLIPISHHDFVITTDGSNLTVEIPLLGFLRVQ